MDMYRLQNNKRKCQTRKTTEHYSDITVLQSTDIKQMKCNQTTTEWRDYDKSTAIHQHVINKYMPSHNVWSIKTNTYIIYIMYIKRLSNLRECRLGSWMWSWSSAITAAGGIFNCRCNPTVRSPVYTSDLRIPAGILLLIIHLPLEVRYSAESGGAIRSEFLAKGNFATARQRIRTRNIVITSQRLWQWAITSSICILLWLILYVYYFG